MKTTIKTCLASLAAVAALTGATGAQADILAVANGYVYWGWLRHDHLDYYYAYSPMYGDYCWGESSTGQYFDYFECSEYLGHLEGYYYYLYS